jgi:methyl-accepting chemotaxis protein
MTLCSRGYLSRIDLVKAFQDQIVVVRRDLEGISVAATTEVEKSKLTANNLQVVQDDLVLVIGGNREISTGAEQIAAAARQAGATAG